MTWKVNPQARKKCAALSVGNFFFLGGGGNVYYNLICLIMESKLAIIIGISFPHADRASSRGGGGGAPQGKLPLQKTAQLHPIPKRSFSNFYGIYLWLLSIHKK